MIMSNREWPADNYAIGSYIQETIADNFLSELPLKPNDAVLDVGCGNGSYTRKILDKVPHGSVLGVDASANMLALARELEVEYPNFSAQQANVLTMNFNNQFNSLVSFWCLQWATDIKLAFRNMLNALKSGGRFFTLFPSGDDPYIQAYYHLRDSKKFSELANFKSPVDYSELDHLAEKLAVIPCTSLNVELHSEKILLPSLEVYKKFVNGIAFYQGQIADDRIKVINEAMVDYFADLCEKKYNGTYYFDLKIYIVRGEK